MGTIRKYLTAVSCVWIFGSCLLCSASTNPSLWGQKVVFQRHSCEWKLRKTHTVPPLEELTVCVNLWRQIYTTEWTVFVYKKPGDSGIELGLIGSGGNLNAWLFGKKWVIAYDLSLQHWHTVCLTWSNDTRQFQVIVNGTVCLNSKLNDSLPSTLFPNGTLTLGVSHSIIEGVIVYETGTNFIGEMSMFRVWGQELSPHETVNLKCVSGNIVTWSMRDWEYTGCPPKTDHNLKCEWSEYEISMKLSISQKQHGGLNRNELKPVVLNWLEEILPPNISVKLVSLENISQTYQADKHLRKDATAVNKFTNTPFNETWVSCLAYVTENTMAAVDETQAELWKLFTRTYILNKYTLRADLDSLNILPVGFGDTFYGVSMNVTVNGSLDNVDEILQLWVKETLERLNDMIVLNFKLTETPKYGCTFQVQALYPVNVSYTQMHIHQLLTQRFDNDSITITVSTDQISILHIDPGSCPEDTTHTVYGVYIWASVPAQYKYTMKCEKGHNDASRFCKLDDNGEAVWDPPDMSNCEKVLTDIDDLESVTVTPDNSADVVDMINDLLYNQTDLSFNQLIIVLQKLSEVTDIGFMTTELVDNIINVISKIFDSTNYLGQATNQILYITEQVGNRIDFSGVSHSTTAPSLALQVLNQDPTLFEGLTFGVSSFQTGHRPEIFLNPSFSEATGSGSVASISLPTDLENFFPHSNQKSSRILFHFYGKENLFHDYSSFVLNSYVVSASVTNATVTNLKDPVIITLRHLQHIEEQETVQCVYWDLKKNNGSGGWDDKGCQLKHTNMTHTSCVCVHLTHFGVLLDVSRTPINPKDDMILTVISYLGCGLSAIFLSVTLLTYLAFEKLRLDYPSKILINLSAALLGLNLLFLVNSWLASFNSHGLCITVAAVLHYFFLATFSWMGLEAINMYLAFVKVFNVYVPSYILKFSAVGWGLPLMIVGIVLAVDIDCYGTSRAKMAVGVSSAFCWIQDDTAFYVTVVAFVVLILICNICVFGVVMVQIRGLQLNKAVGRHSGVLHNLRVVASLTFLLGLTWLLAFFAWGPVQVPLLYLFALLNSMQGFFIFLFHCLMKENVRKQWRVHLCCGKFRLTDYSEWSGSLTLGGRPKEIKRIVLPSESTSQRKISDFSRTSRNDEAWKKKNNSTH